MKTVFVLTISIFCSLLGFGQLSFTINPVPGSVLDTGQVVTISTNASEVWMVAQGQKPDSTNTLIGGVFTPSKDSMPVFALKSTTTDDVALLPEFMDSANAVPDSVYVNCLIEIQKVHSLNFYFPEYDTTVIVHYTTQEAIDMAKGELIVMNTYVDWLEYFGSLGIGVPGDGTLLGSISGDFLTIPPGSATIDLVGADSSDLTGTIWSVYGSYALPSTSPGDTFPVMEVAIHALDSMMYVFGSPTDTFTIPLMHWWTDSVSIYAEWDSVFEYASLLDLMGGENVPNFAIGWRTPIKQYPQFDHVRWKQCWLTIVDSESGSVWHDGPAECETNGNYSSYNAYKGEDIKMKKGQRVEVPLFDNSEIDQFQTVRLRPGGSSQFWDIANDDIGHMAMYPYLVGCQASRPAMYFRQGEFNGQTQVREKLNRHHLANHTGFDDDDIYRFKICDGCFSLFPTDGQPQSVTDSVNSWFAYAMYGDPFSPNFVTNVQRHMDVESIFKTRITDIIIGNRDLGGNNTGWYLTPDGILHETLKDLDISMDYWRVDYNHLVHALLNMDTSEFDYGYVQAQLITNLIQNEYFLNMFINICADLQATAFYGGRWGPMTDTITANIQKLLDPTAERWAHVRAQQDSADYEWNRQQLIAFATERSGYVYGHIMDTFSIDTTAVIIDIVLSDSACLDMERDVVISTISAFDAETPIRYTDTEVPLYALGEGFQYWLVNADTVMGSEFTRVFDADTTYFITAVFGCPVYETDSNSRYAVINELMASNDTTYADPEGDYDDWIELYNPTDLPMNLANYHISDKGDNLTKHQFLPEDSLVIPPHGFLIVWADEDGSGHLNFKLKASSEGVYFSDPGGILLDFTEWNTSAGTDNSLGRCHGSWSVQPQPTPMDTNDCPPAIILGVDFIDFDVIPGDDSIHLDAHFAESPDESIYVMRAQQSEAGLDWEYLGVLQGVTFDDYNVVPGVRYYYQLGWSSDSSSVKSGMINPTGIRKIEVQIIPNPSDGNIFVSGEYVFEIYNTQGQLVFSGEGGVQHYVSTPQGIYFVVFYDSQNLEFVGKQKLVIK